MDATITSFEMTVSSVLCACAGVKVTSRVDDETLSDNDVSSTSVGMLCISPFWGAVEDIGVASAFSLFDIIVTGDLVVASERSPPDPCIPATSLMIASEGLLVL